MFLVKYSSETASEGVFIPVNDLINNIDSDPLGKGLWLTAMVSLMLLPTVAHMLILVLGGIAQFIPNIWKDKLSKELECIREKVNKKPEKIPAQQIDSLSWNLTLFDKVSGAFVFFFFVYLFIKMLSYFLKSIGEGIEAWMIWTGSNIFDHNYIIYFSMMCLVFPII